MECREVITWMVDEDRWTSHIAEKAFNHMAACATCKKVYDLNDLVEIQAHTALRQISAAPDLLARIKTDIQSTKTKRFHPTLRSAYMRLAPAFAVLAIFLFFILNPFSGQIGSLGEIGSYALANHIDTEVSMSFRTGQISDVSGWFSKRLGFPIRIPAGITRTFNLLGGRECDLGKKKAAYLHYDRQGEKVSLFIIKVPVINRAGPSLPVKKRQTFRTGAVVSRMSYLDPCLFHQRIA